MRVLGAESNNGETVDGYGARAIRFKDKYGSHKYRSEKWTNGYDKGFEGLTICSLKQGTHGLMRPWDQEFKLTHTLMLPSPRQENRNFRETLEAQAALR